MKNNMITTINTSNENKDKNENEDDKTTTTLVSRTIFYRNVLTVIFLLLVTFALSRETIMHQYKNKNKNKNNKKVAVDDNNNDGIIGFNFVVGPYNHYDVNVFKLFSYQQRQYKNNKNNKNAVDDDENNNNVHDRMLRGRGRGRVFGRNHSMGSHRPTNTRFIHASSPLTVDTSSKIPSKMFGYSPTTTTTTTTPTTIQHHLDRNILNTATISFMDDNVDEDGNNKEDYFVRNRNKRNKNETSGKFPLLGQWFRQRFDGFVASTSSSTSKLIKDDTKRRHRRRQLRARDTTTTVDDDDDKNNDSISIVSTSGNDRDDYGCINSAGYSWCESQKECIRVWKSTCATTATATATAATATNTNILEVVVEDKDEENKDSNIGIGTTTIGNDNDRDDEYDCLLSAGYFWCESTKECLRPWEETTCPTTTTTATTSTSTNSGMMILGNNSRSNDHNCLPSAGYFWCHSTNECIRPWETTCPATTTVTT